MRSSPILHLRGYCQLRCAYRCDPVFVHYPRTFCMDPVAAEAAVSGRTRAVMPVHLYGHDRYMPAFRGWRIGTAGRHRGRGRGPHSQPEWDAGPGVATRRRFPLPTKNMTSGQGGMVSVSRLPETDRHHRLLRNQGMERQLREQVVGSTTG